jgi:large subunit ribosomal protein L6
MSRIGKLPIELPEKVEAKVDGDSVKVKGPKGELDFTFKSGLVNIAMDGKTITVQPCDKNEKKSVSMWGTARTLINNMVVGVSEGFVRSLEFNGVGYKAAVKGGNLELNLGYSHPITYELPEGVSAKVTKNVIDLSGCSKELVGFAAAKIRSFRPPEPYKGKGVKYTDETIIRKAGKSGGK